LCMLQLERPLVSRVREIRMHGLKGVPAPSCESAGRSRFYQSLWRYTYSFIILFSSIEADDYEVLPGHDISVLRGSTCRFDWIAETSEDLEAGCS